MWELNCVRARARARAKHYVDAAGDTYIQSLQVIVSSIAFIHSIIPTMHQF